MLRTVLWSAAVGAIAASASASAAGPAYESFPSRDGITQFPNATVVHRPDLANASSSGQSGLKADIDENGALRAPTNEELAAEAAAGRSSSSAPQARRFSAARTSSGATMADGSTTVVLDDSTMLNSVVVRQADGSLTEVCVPASEAKDIHDGKIDAKSLAQKELHHDR